MFNGLCDSGNAAGPLRQSWSTQFRLLPSIKEKLCPSMKVTFPEFHGPYKYKRPTRGTNVFLKIEGDLQAMCDVHHLAFPPLALPLGLEFLYGGRDEGALSPSALSTLLLLTYEDAMGAREWFIIKCAPLAPSHISNVVRWGGVLSSVCTWTLRTR